MRALTPLRVLRCAAECRHFGPRHGREVFEELKNAPELGVSECLIASSKASQPEVDENSSLCIGEEVAIAPDDTGRGDPTIGTLVASSAEEFVIMPRRLEAPPKADVRVHFPRLAFVARPVH